LTYPVKDAIIRTMSQELLEIDVELFETDVASTHELQLTPVAIPTPEKPTISHNTSRAKRLCLSAAGLLLAGVAHMGISTPAAEAASAAAPSTENVSYTVATYNILASNHVETGRRIGGSVEARAKRVSQFILGKAGTQPIDLVALQEVNSGQRKMIKERLSDYKVYPHSSNNNPFFYNPDVFKFVSGGILHYPSDTSRGLIATGGKGTSITLENRETGEIIDASNIHATARNEAGGSDRGGAQKRAKAARIVRSFHAQKHENHPDHTQMAFGDYNSTVVLRTTDQWTPVPKDLYLFKHGGRDELPYCLMTTRPSLLQSMYDLERNRYGHCLTTKDVFPLDRTVDWIYVTPDPDGKDYEWQRIHNEITQHASDHMPIMGTITSK
jgi:endonuclease/exonuclease/phosphatase family metal-dependent hydrolase